MCLPKRIQKIVGSSPDADFYNTDGYMRHTDVIYPGSYIRNIHNKKGTYNVENINVNLRYYSSVFEKQNKYFIKSLKALKTVLKFLLMRIINLVLQSLNTDESEKRQVIFQLC